MLLRAGIVAREHAIESLSEKGGSPKSWLVCHVKASGRADRGEVDLDTAGCFKERLDAINGQACEAGCLLRRPDDFLEEGTHLGDVSIEVGA